MSSPHDHYADGDHRPTPGKEADVPEEQLSARSGFVDVVEAENLMIDNAFDQVECSEADEHCRDEVGRRPAEMAEATGPPKDEETGEHEDVGTRMEDAVPEGVQFKVLDRCDRVPGTEHMMPLQKLVKNNAVEEASESEAQEQAGGQW